VFKTEKPVTDALGMLVKMANTEVTKKAGEGI
jgi:hypothetical protein